MYTGRKCQTLLLFLLFCMSPLVSRWHEPCPDPTHIPPLHNDRELGTILRSLSPGLPSPGSRVRHRFLHTHFLTKEKLRPDKKRGAAPEEEPGSPGDPRPRLLGLQSHPRPRAALPAGPSTHTPDLPGPRTLQSTATASGGMMSASSPHLGSSFLASFWAKAELNVTFTMARPGAPSEGGGGLEAGAAGSWLQLQPPRPGSGRGSAAAEER